MTIKMHPELAGLVLAAGGSARLGRPKQLVIWRDKPLIIHAINDALAVCGAGVTVVTGAQAEAVERAVTTATAGNAVSIVRNAGWEQGMSTSLRSGMQAIATSDARAVLILLCDQPLISSLDIERLVEVWADLPDRPAATQYNNVCGVPAIFPAAMFSQLSQLDGDQGARSLLTNLSSDRSVQVENIELDIDTPEDLQQLLQNTDKHN